MASVTKSVDGEFSTAWSPSHDMDVEQNAKNGVIQDGYASTNMETKIVIDPELEARMKRKLDFNLIPLVFFLCMLNLQKEWNRALN